MISNPTGYPQVVERSSKHHRVQPSNKRRDEPQWLGHSRGNGRFMAADHLRPQWNQLFWRARAGVQCSRLRRIPVFSKVRLSTSGQHCHLANRGQLRLRTPVEMIESAGIHNGLLTIVPKEGLHVGLLCISKWQCTVRMTRRTPIGTTVLSSDGCICKAGLQELGTGHSSQTEKAGRLSYMRRSYSRNLRYRFLSLMPSTLAVFPRWPLQALSTERMCALSAACSDAGC